MSPWDSHSGDGAEALLSWRVVGQIEFLALRKTLLCKARTHFDPVCAACHLVRKGKQELFKVSEG